VAASFFSWNCYLRFRLLSRRQGDPLTQVATAPPLDLPARKARSSCSHPGVFIPLCIPTQKEPPISPNWIHDVRSDG
jgi:hypothetical protein